MRIPSELESVGITGRRNEAAAPMVCIHGPRVVMGKPVEMVL